MQNGTKNRKQLMVTVDPPLVEGMLGVEQAQGDFGKWAPEVDLTRGIINLFELALESDLDRIKLLPTRKRKPDWRDLSGAIQINSSEFSRWSSGKEKRGVIPTTRRLRGLFKGERYIERRGDKEAERADQQFAYDLLAYWKRTRNSQVDGIVLLLMRHEEKISEVENAERLAEARRIEERISAQTRPNAPPALRVNNEGYVVERNEKQPSHSDSTEDDSFASDICWLRSCKSGHMNSSGWPTSLAARVGLDRSSQITICIDRSAHAVHVELMRTEAILKSLDQEGRFPSRTWTRASGWFAETKSDAAIVELAEFDSAILSKDTVEGVVQSHFGRCGETLSPVLVLVVSKEAEKMAHRIVEVFRSSIGVERRLSVDILKPSDYQIDIRGLRSGDAEFVSLIRDFDSMGVKQPSPPSRTRTPRLQKLIEWLSGGMSDECYFSQLTARDAKLVIESGRLGFGAARPTPNAIRRSTTLVGAAARNHELLPAIGSLPIDREVVHGLINSPVHVRAVAGLITRNEMLAVPVPWFRKPIDAWRHGRALTIWGR